MLQRSEALDAVFHALSDPGRRRMVERLTHGSASVSQLATPLPMSLSAVAQHLKVLEDSGLVRTEKRGRERICSLEDKALSCAEDWITQRRASLVERLDWADAAQRRQWFFTGDADWVIAELQQDFHVGGRELARFGPKGDPQYRHEGYFLDIVPDRRIVTAGSMHNQNGRSSSTLCTIDIQADGDGSKVILTDQSV